MPEEPPWPAALERGEAGAPLAGESRSGDLAVFAPYDGGALVATIDGLGHGAAAADAAGGGRGGPRRAPGRPARGPAQALPRRAALDPRRGGDAGLVRPRQRRAELDRDRQRRGPARARRPQRGDSADSPTLFGGVLGWSLPAVRVVRTELAPGDCLVMATDGVAADFGSSLMPGVPAPEQAKRVLASHARGSDDALVVAVRYLP